MDDNWKKPANLPWNPAERAKLERVIVVLEGCWLDVDKVGSQHELLNCDDHRGFLNKRGEDYADYRPDIVHQCLLTLLDSPLNRAGLLQVYISSQKGVLVEVHPQLHVPRSFWQFSRLWVELTKSQRVRATTLRRQLLKTVKNPVTQYLPVGCRIVGTSAHVEHKVDLQDWVDKLPDDGKSVVFVVGGLSRGSIDPPYVTEKLCVSGFNLSASVVCAKICNAFENKWIPEPEVEA